MNKIGSALYGHIAAVFILGILSRRVAGPGALAGLAGGLAVNLVLWLFFEKEVSWMWWNIIGFMVAAGTGMLSGIFTRGNGHAVAERLKGRDKTIVIGYTAMLLAWFAAIVIACAAAERLLVRFLSVYTNN